ncbi:MAG: type II secretion system protein [Planctomycetota bacterium]
MKRAFSLVELIIVVAVLGILAAIVVPQFRSHSTQAKKAVAKDSLRILRSAIELYTAQHGGVPPGYENDDPQNSPTSSSFYNQLVVNRIYLSKIPKNPFNNLQDMRMIGNAETFPQNPIDGYGWVYHPATKTIRLSWPGSDSDGIRYFDY